MAQKSLIEWTESTWNSIAGYSKGCQNCYTERMVHRLQAMGQKKFTNKASIESRWISFGPYYAMFPVEFAVNVIKTFSKENDFILDPFCGRGTTLFASSMLNRQAVGIDINPLGWLYASVKLNPATFKEVKKRLLEIDIIAKEKYSGAHQNYDDFFKMCYSSQVLDFLTAARQELQWKRNKADRTLMAFLAVHLHGKHGSSLSNQMQQVKACGPNYAIKWWNENGYETPDINPVELIIKKLEWRYSKGQPRFKNSKVYLGDSMEYLSRQSVRKNKYKLLFTSPPYAGVTDYFHDQWLRLWLLGGAPEQKKIQHRSKNTFGNRENYRELLFTVFKKSRKILADDASLYIRTDARKFTRDTTIDVLSQLFPEKDIKIIHRPFTKRTQTALHGDSSQKPGEVDIILTP